MQQLSDIVGRIINGEYDSILIALVDSNGEGAFYSLGEFTPLDILTELQAAEKLKDITAQLN
jgi:hypothetical protein